MLVVGGMVLAVVGQVEHDDGRVTLVVAGPLGAALVARAEQAAKDAAALVVEGVEVEGVEVAEEEPAPCGCVSPNGCDVCDPPGKPGGWFGDAEGDWA